ncbi:hypothetical protein FAZ95_02095 [Trinickia violacea]|uniref:DUF1795 domain-containing protein n=1 Tax=Trinickia violacea TaxID=2571746 RepID=A0A4V1EHV7_9BURK|nr:hypothetical protein [Trinickia violacea]QCP51610.1 hypothetical protein FAZ95_02095 [Trinickia violacea]
MLRAFAGAAILGCALTACSPDYDWRTIMNSADGYTIDLPAKPLNDERDVDIGGARMKMKMQSAHAEGVVFAVGTVILPSDDPQLRQAVLDYLRTGLARNLGAAPEARTTQVPLAAGGMVPGLEMSVSGDAGEKREHRTIQVRLVARGKHVYQAAIIADKAPPQEQVDQFFQSFKLY